MQISGWKDRSPLPQRPTPRPELPREQFHRSEPGPGLIPRVLLVAAVALATTSAQAATADQLIAGVEQMRSGQVATPTYLGGSHSDWKGSNDHCYSIYFRVAIRQGLLSEAQAEDLMARMHGNQPDAFRQNLFPHGYQRIELNGTQVLTGAIPAGQLVSMDGSDHVMMSTGRLIESGEHEVYSFKGGGIETPVWGDSVGYDPGAKIHKTTIENELRALQLDEQPIENIVLTTGRSALEGR